MILPPRVARRQNGRPVTGSRETLRSVILRSEATKNPRICSTPQIPIYRAVYFRPKWRDSSLSSRWQLRCCKTRATPGSDYALSSQNRRRLSGGARNGFLRDYPQQMRGYLAMRPLRMQEVQTTSVLWAPFTRALTLRRFGFQRREVTLWA